MEHRRHFVEALIWIAFIILQALCLLFLYPNSKVSTNILDLLPNTQVLPKIQEQYLERLDRQVVYALKAPEDVSEEFLKELAGNKQILSIRGRLTPEDKKEFWENVRDFRFGLLPDKEIDRLRNPEKLARRVLSQVYSPISGISGEELRKDPLLLTRASLGNQQTTLEERNGWLVGKIDGSEWKLIFLELKKGLTADERSDFISWQNKLRESLKEKNPNVEIVSQGSIFYSEYATDIAKTDITKLGTLSSLILLVLFFVTFRSVRPIFLCLVSVAVGILCGLVATLLCFDKLYSVTLIMCVGLIGVSTDYTTYYLCALRASGDNRSPWEVMQSIRPSLIHAMLTTVLAYGVMVVAPFPGLQQLAVFAVAGLTSSCLTVMVLFPYLISKGNLPKEGKLGWVQTYLSCWQKKKTTMLSLLVILALVSGFGIFRVNPQDSLLLLQTPPASLKKQESIISQLLQKDFAQQWLIVSAQNEETLLSKIEQLRERYQDRGSLIPPLRSAQKQQEIRTLIQAAQPIVKKTLEKSGFEVDLYEPAKTITLSDFLSSKMGEAYRQLLFVQDGKCYFVIPNFSEPDASSLGTVINRRGEIESVLENYRQLLGKLLFVSFILIILSYCYRFGLKQAIGAAICLAFAILTAISSLGFVGWPLNIFSLFALILVMGIGVDYAVFFSSLQEKRRTAFFAMLIAALSTLTSLGILIFCHTDAVRNFSLVLSTGVLTMFLVSPLMQWFQRDE